MKQQVTLLQRFSVVALLTTVAIGAVMGWQITGSIEETEVQRARDQLAQVIMSEPFWLEMDDPTAEFSRTHTAPADSDRWQSSTDAMLKGYPIYRIKVWSPSHQLVWSDDPAIIGQIHPENEEVNEALEGKVVSEVTDMQKLERMTDGIGPKVLELYVPAVTKDSKIIGAFEIYQEASELYDAIDREQYNTWLLISCLMATFYMVLFVMVANASRTISRLQRVEQLERYFSPAVAQAIGSIAGRRQKKNAPLTGRAEATVLFTDIRGFTRHTETMEPEAVVTMLSDYVDLVTNAVFQYGGSVDKFLGDGVLAVFGAPLPQADHALKALKAAHQIRHDLKRLNAERVGRNEQPLLIGTATATGPVITGTLGRTSQLAYTVLGDTVNLASRLVGLARPGELLATHKTLEHAGSAVKDIGMTFEGPVTTRVRGRKEEVTVFASHDPEVENMLYNRGLTTRDLILGASPFPF